MRSLLMIPDDCIYSHLRIFLMITSILIFLMIASIYIFLMIVSIFNLIFLMIASLLIFAFLLLLDIYSIINQCFLYSCAAFSLNWITDHLQANIPLLKKSKAPKGPMVAFFRAAKDRCMPQCVCSGPLDTTTRLDCFCLLMNQETY